MARFEGGAHTEQISFRLPVAAAKVLDHARGADSRGEYARKLVMSGLNGGGISGLQAVVEEVGASVSGRVAEVEERQAALEQQVGRLADGLERLREDFATAVVAVLVAGGRSSQEEAEEWARKHLLYGRKKR